MDNTPSPQGPLTMLLQTIIDNQRVTGDKLDNAVATMATKEDIASLREDLKGTVSKEDYKELADRVADLEANRMPKWFWGFVAVVVAVFTPIVDHFWK